MPDYQYITKIISDSAAKLGHQVKFVGVKTSEIKRMYEDGVLDGDCGRLKDYEKVVKLPSFERITPSFRQVSFSLWKTDLSKSINDGVVGYYGNTGPFLERVLSKNNRAVSYADLDSLINALVNQNVDFMFTWDASLHQRQKELFEKGIQYHALLAVAPGYVLIHKKHKKLQELVRKEIAYKNSKSDYYDYAENKIPDQVVGKIIFSCGVHAQSSEFKVFNNVYSKLFNLMGLDFEMISLPLVRIRTELLNQRIDGVCGGTEVWKKMIPGLVRVPVKVMKTSHGLWAYDFDGRPDSFSLEESDKVAVMRGDMLGKNYLAKVKSKVVNVHSAKSGFAMMAANRADYFVVFDVLAEDVLKNNNFQKDFYRVDIVSEIDVYPYLIEKHEKLVEPLKVKLQQYLERHNKEMLFE